MTATETSTLMTCHFVCTHQADMQNTRYGDVNVYTKIQRKVFHHATLLRIDTVSLCQQSEAKLSWK